MYMLRRRTVLGCLPAAVLPLAHAQPAWPSRPITLIVPFTPGGGTDAVGRLVAQKLGESLGQSVVVENVGGGGGTIGTQKAVNAARDGYTLLLGVDSPVAISQFVNPQAVRYDAPRDLAPIGLISTQPLVLMGRPDLPVNSFTELLTYARSNPGKLSYATSGVGTVLHLNMERIKDIAKMHIVHVPYRGGAQAVTDLIGGQVDLAFLPTGSAVPIVSTRKVKGLLVTSRERVASLAGVPAISEFPAFSKLELLAWIGLFAPAGTPAPIVQRLNQELNSVLQQPDVRARFAEQAVTPGGGTPEQFGAFVRSEQARYQQIVKSANIRE